MKLSEYLEKSGETLEGYLARKKREESGKTTLSDYRSKTRAELANTDISDIYGNLEKGGYVDRSTISSYKNRLDDYINKYSYIYDKSNEDAQSYLDNLKSLQEGVNKYHDYAFQFESDKAFEDYYKRTQLSQDLYDQATNAEDYQKYSGIGAAIKNPTVDEAEGFMNVFGKPVGGKDVGNIVTYSRDNNEYLRMGDANASNMVGDSRYASLTEDEVSVYNYWLAKENEGSVAKGTAQSYLDSMDDILNQREGKSIAEGINGSLGLELVFGAAAGLSQFASGVQNEFKSLFGSDDTYIAPTLTDYASKNIRENLGDVGGKFLGSSTGQIAYDVVTTTANMLPTIMVSAITGGTAGEILGTSLMGFSAGGNYYQEFLNEGMNKNQARALSTALGVWEGASEYFLGSIEGLAGNKISEKLGKTAIIGNLKSSASGFTRALMRFFDNFVDVGQEGLEEVIQDIGSTIIKGVMTGEWDEINFQEEAYNFTLGALSAAFMNTPANVVGNSVNDFNLYRSGKSIIKLGGVDALKNLAVETANEYKGNENISKYANNVASKPTAMNVGILNSKVEELRQQNNQKSIENSLVEQMVKDGTKINEAKKQASKISDKLYRSYNGEEVDISKELKNESVKKVYDNLTNNEYSAVKYRDEHHTETREGIVQDYIQGKIDKAEADKTLSEKFSSTDNGKTINTTTGEEITLASSEVVASNENGKMTLKLENGSTIEASNVSFGSKGEAVLYATIADMGVETHIANTLIDSALGTDEKNMISTAMGIRDAFWYGSKGVNYSELVNGVFTSKLSEQQSKIAYNLGKTDAIYATSKKTAPVTIKKASKYKNEYKVDNGRIRHAKFDNLNDQKLSGISLAKMLSKLGANVYVFESTLEQRENGKENGSYVSSDGSIHIDINSGTDGQGLVAYTISHEFTHFIEEWSPQKFKKYADLLFDELGKDNKSVTEMLHAELDRLRSVPEYKNMSDNQLRDIAYSEVVAKCSEKLFTDTDALQRIADKLAKTDKSLLDKIIEFFKGLVQRLKSDYEGQKSNSILGDEAIDTINRLESIRDAFADAAVDALQNYRNADVEVLNNAGLNYDEKTGTVYSRRFSTGAENEANVDREELINSIVNLTGISKKEAENYLKAEEVASMSIKGTFLDFEGNEKEVAIKSNSDYPQGTIDLTNICTKRVPVTNLTNRLQEALPEDLFTADDYADIRLILMNDGRIVACGLCFVEDRRQYLGEIAQDFINEWANALNGGSNLKRLNSTGQVKDVSIGADLAKRYGVEPGKVNPTKVRLRQDMFSSSTQWFKLQKNHPEVAAAFEAFNNARGQSAGRLLLDRAEYKREILGWSEDKVKSVNDVGGLRIFSFSDFEAVHLLDLLQIIEDCAAKGVKIQGYTKQTKFAKLVSNTGLKLNRSFIPYGATGLKMVNGKKVLAIDTVEGINNEDVNFLDESDNPNVGNNITGISDEQIHVAMLDNFFHYIIPFHTNKKAAANKKLGVANWRNYKLYQTDKTASSSADIKKVFKLTYQNKMNGMSDTDAYDKALKDTGIKFSALKEDKMVNIYTDVLTDPSVVDEKSFLIKYLEVCNERDIVPRYAQFLNLDKDGNFLYTEGYTKFLVDFKLFDYATGEILPQGLITPNFDTEFIQSIIEDEFKKTERERSGADYPEALYNDILNYIRAKHGYKDVDTTSYKKYKKIVNEMVEKANRDENGTRGASVSPSVLKSDRDSDGNKLSKEQQEFFKDSKVRDEDGNLKVMYHGTNKYGFTIFKTDINSNGNNIGSHFGSQTVADQFANEKGNPGVYKVYLNIKNPYDTYDWFAQDDYFPASVASELAQMINTRESQKIIDSIKELDPNIAEIVEDPDLVDEGYLPFDKNIPFEESKQYVLYNGIRQLLEMAGYDGLSYENTLEDDGNIDYIALYPSQIKNIDNKNPTSDPDIRYSLRGINSDGIEVYETSDSTKNLSWKERVEKFSDMLNGEYLNKTARFVRNGHTYYASLDKTNPVKSLYGERHFSSDGKKAYIKEGADGGLFDLISNSKYNGSRADTKDHKSKDGFTDYFDYFVKSVQIDNKVFDVVATVKKKYNVKDGYTYTLYLRNNNEKKASPAVTEIGFKVEGDAFGENYKSSEDISQDNIEKFSDRILMGSEFSGGGMLEAGLIYQMLDKEFAVEYDEKIAAVYRDNWGDQIYAGPERGDVHKFDISKHANDLFYFHASPVCHNFSKAKHNHSEHPMDIKSARKVANDLEVAKPQVFTVENAPEYLNSKSLKIITDKLDELGYKWRAKVYNSADYGSATSRERCILTAVKTGELPSEPKKMQRTNSWDKVTRDLWTSLKVAKAENGKPMADFFVKALRNTKKLQGIFNSDGTITVDRPLLVITTTAGNEITFAWEGSLCPTLTTKCGEGKLILPGNHISLDKPNANILRVSPKFMGTIQGLPDNYNYGKASTRAFTIIGNGIPTHLTKAVIGGVLDSAYEQTHEGKKLYSDRDNTNYAPVFYSQMGKVIDAIKPDKMSSNGVVNYLKGKGIKNEEIKWSGIEAFLEGKKSVSKKELQEFVAGSMLQIEEETRNDLYNVGKYIGSDSDVTNISEGEDDGGKYIRVSYEDHGWGDNLIRDHIMFYKDNETGRYVSTMYGDEGFSSESELRKAFKNKPKWGDYKIEGGSNYREMLFKIPNSDYSNQSMNVHWGEDGVLAHARMQDMKTVDGKKMIFIEEIQSDWHNEGNKNGYFGKESMVKLNELKGKLDELFFDVEDYSTELTGVAGEWEAIEKTKKGSKLLSEYREAKISYDNAMNEYQSKIPDAPFKDTYTDYVLKRLLRMAAEEGYDSIGWTTARQQEERWSDEFAEGYRIEYDQDMPKFLNKYGKKWNGKVDKTNLQNGIEVWQFVIPESMKESVLYEGQTLYSDRDVFGFTIDKNARVNEDLLEELSIYDPSAKVDRNGNVTVYHRTNEKSAETIRRTGIMKAKEDALFFSSQPTGYADGYGDTVVTFSIPSTVLELNDIFDGEVHFDVPLRRINGEWQLNVSKYLVEDAKYSDREGISNRSLLANALESVAQNDIEKSKLNQYKKKIELMNAEEKKLSDIKAKIKELSFAKGHRDAEQINRLQKSAKEIEGRINYYDKQLFSLEASKPLKYVLAREYAKAKKIEAKRYRESLNSYKESSAKTVRTIIQKNQESRKKSVEGRNKTALRNKVKKVVSELNQYLKDNKVLIGMQKVVAEALDAINMDTVGADERIAKYNELIAKTTDPDMIKELTKTRDRIDEQGDKLKSKLERLKIAYSDIINSTDQLIANSHDEVIENKLEDVIQKVGDTSIRDMSLEQLESVYDLYKMILTSVRQANKSFKFAKTESISKLGENVRSEVKSVGGYHDREVAALRWLKKFGWKSLKPIYAMRMIGSDTLTELFKNVRKGEDTWYGDMSQAKAFKDAQYKKYGYSNWDFDKQYEFTSKSGKKFTMTLDQIMSLYAFYKREQAIEHLIKGGIVFDSSIEVTEKKHGVPVKYNVNTATAFNLSEEIIGKINSTLTDEQRKFVDEMQAYLSDVMAEKGNEVAIEMYGVKLFKEKVYFPLKSAKLFMYQQNEVAGEVRIKNSGFSKSTVAHASNPIIMSNFMDVWASHVNDMSMYHSFVLPLEDFNRVWNYKTATDEKLETMSVKQTLQDAYGTGVNEYISTLLTDLNGGARQSGSEEIGKLMGLAKKGAVFASASVTIQQPSAVCRAMAYINPKYFGKSVGKALDFKQHSSEWEECKKYAPIAGIKEMGYFDTGMGQSSVDWMKSEEYEGFRNKLEAFFKDGGYRDEVLSKAPSLADELTWCHIWNAVKSEIADTTDLEVGSEEFLQRCGERFTEVITLTQVYDSVLSRSGLMRSKDTGMKMATAFMAEPTTTMNMVADAIVQAKRIGGKQGAKIISKVVGSVTASIVLNSILKSIVTAWRHMGDDDDKSYIERYGQAVLEDFLDNINPMTYIPFVKDIVSLFQGYSVERMDMTLFEEFVNSIKALDSSKKSTYQKVAGIIGSVSAFFGIPVKNIERDLRPIIQKIIEAFK